MQRVKMMKKYADLILRVGLNSAARQDVMVVADVSMANFVSYFVGELFKMKVQNIRVYYKDPNFQRLFLLNTKEKKVGQIPESTVVSYKEACLGDFTMFIFEGTSPDLIRRLPESKREAFNKALRKACSPYLDKYKNEEIPVVKVAVPTREWAIEVYPQSTPVQAEDQLWRDVYRFAGILEERLDAESVYTQKIDRLNAICKKLNEMKFQGIGIKDPTTKTDLKVFLPIRHLWISPYKKIDRTGKEFLTHLPGFAIETAAHSHSVEGILNAAGPVFVNGEAVEGASFSFKNGKVVEFDATKNKDLLSEAFSEDEFAARLGGIGLVDLDAYEPGNFAPFGDNILANIAGSRLTFGQASIKCCNKGYNDSRDVLMANGFNCSNSRINVPIASPTLYIYGFKVNGTKTDIIKNGKWAL